MPITLEHIAAKPFQEKLKAKGIRTWDTIQYLSALDGAYKDTVFHEQISNLPKDYIHLDEMARDEKEYSLNVFDFSLNQRLRLYVTLLNQLWIFIIRIVQPFEG